mgnify:CR=1 FL=1
MRGRAAVPVERVPQDHRTSVRRLLFTELLGLAS